jgi:ATP-binding cassette subfamily F protein uup
MAPPLLFLEDIRLTFGGTPLLSGASLSVGAGARIGLVGRNGSGKSTLLKIAAGLVEPDSGERFVQPGATLRYLPQEPDLSGHESVLSYVEAGLAPGDDPWRASHLLEQLGMDGAASPDRLSGGERRRAALARTLAPQPDILLLDEPTNHLDLPAIEWLEEELSAMRSAIVLISHDRRLLEDLTRETVWLDRGVSRTLAKGFSAFEEWRDRVLEEEETASHKLARQIVREEHWMRYGVTARRKRNMRRVRELAEMRQKKRSETQAAGSVNLARNEAALSGKLVAELKGVSKSFPTRDGESGRDIVRGLDLIVRRGDRLGLVGPNGAGKTTLVRLITGEMAPDSGSVRLGVNLEALTIEQDRDSLDPAIALRDALTDGAGDQVTVGGEAKHVASYMKDFLFSPEQAGTPIGRLSGGERGRLMLARGLRKPSNLLILDEPTNDLDLETLDLLQEYLADYSGTVIVVSHDRDFLDRVCTSVLASDGDGRWTEYSGGYSDMVAQKGSGVAARRLAEKPAAAQKPKADANLVAAAPAKAKLSFKQKHRLETLPAEMAKLEGEIAKLKAALEDPDLYARDRKKFDAAAAALTQRQEQLAACEEEWLELEMLREQAGA